MPSLFLVSFILADFCKDATDAIKHNPKFVKAYYRRGSAQVALGHYDLAVKDFKTVCKMEP